MGKIKLVDSVPPSKSGLRMATVDELRAHRGRWALVGRYKTRSTAGVTQFRLRGYGDDIEVVVRHIDDGTDRQYHVYARSQRRS